MSRGDDELFVERCFEGQLTISGILCMACISIDVRVQYVQKLLQR